MPTYVYRREDGSTFETRQRITEDPLEKCPETGQRVTRLISGGAGLIFKGSGFYETDYARDSTSSTSSNGKDTSSDSTSSDSNTSSEKTTASTEAE